MNEATHSTTLQLVCKVIVILLGIGAIWFYLSVDRHFIWPGRCAGVNLKVDGGEVRGAQLAEDHLAIIADFPSQHVTKIILYDYCSGNVLSSVESSK